MSNESLPAIRSRAADFARRELTGTYEGVFDQEAWQRLAAFGALRMTVPSEHGGQGRTLLEFVAMMEGLGQATCRVGALFAVSAQVFGAIEPIRLAGTADQQARYLPKLASGELRAAHGVTEPQGGSDIAALSTTARRNAKGWEINGQKHCITNGAVAELHLVYARTDEGGRPGLSCFIVDPGTPGVQMTPLHPMGMSGCGLGTVSYERMEVPLENVLGQVGAGQMLFQGSIERERACIFGFAVGVMQRQLDETVAFANGREVGGRKIAAHQAVSHRIADMALRLKMARLVLEHATTLKAAGKRAPQEAAIAKVYISEAFVQSSLDALQIRGGSGYTREGGVEQTLRDALGGTLYSGTNDVLRNLIAAYAGVTP